MACVCIALFTINILKSECPMSTLSFVKLCNPLCLYTQVFVVQSHSWKSHFQRAGVLRICFLCVLD